MRQGLGRQGLDRQSRVVKTDRSDVANNGRWDMVGLLPSMNSWTGTPRRELHFHYPLRIATGINGGQKGAAGQAWQAEAAWAGKLSAGLFISHHHAQSTHLSVLMVERSVGLVGGLWT